MIWKWNLALKICHDNKKKWEKRNIERLELANQGRFLTLRENESNKYLGILEADTIKQAGMKENIKRSTSEERENFAVEIMKTPKTLQQKSWKYLKSPRCKIFGTILKMD